MNTQDLENQKIWPKERMFRPRKRDKKFKTIFAEIKTIFKSNEKL